MIDTIERSYTNGYEQGAKDYKEQRDLLLQERAELFGKIEQLTKERDAAVADLKSVMPCKSCKHCGVQLEFCKDCYAVNNFEWRGIDG